DHLLIAFADQGRIRRKGAEEIVDMRVDEEQPVVGAENGNDGAQSVQVSQQDVGIGRLLDARYLCLLAHHCSSVPLLEPDNAPFAVAEWLGMRGSRNFSSSQALRIGAYSLPVPAPILLQNL